MAGQKRYMSFCKAISCTAIPASEGTLLTFVSHLAQEGLAYSSIKVYLSAVRNLHAASGLHVTFEAQLTPRLEQVLSGIKKEYARGRDKTQRLPVTQNIMEKMQAVLSSQRKDHNSVMLWAACCMAFFGFLNSQYHLSQTITRTLTCL